MVLTKTVVMVILTLVILVLGLAPMFIAEGKGFKAIRWYFSPAIISLIIVLRLPSSRDKDISREEAKEREEKGNKIGLMLVSINVSMYVIWEFIINT